MTKIIFGFFAHPDDEVFAVGGTLLLESQSGTITHLVTLTNGNAGANPDGHTNLGEERLKEWRTAGKLLGVSSQHYFGYEDGRLNNLAMIEIAEQIEKLVTTELQNTSSDTEVEFLTLDLNGYTGHIDHIVAARAATLAFYRLKNNDKRFSHIRYSCLPDSLAPTLNTDWIYMEAGHSMDTIDEVVDARHLHDTLITIVRAHHSQRHDGEALIENRGVNLGLNYFIVKS